MQIVIDRGAAEALAEAAEVRCGLLAAHMDRLPEGDRALVMGEIVRVQRGAEAVRAALGPRSGRLWRETVAEWHGSPL